MPNPAPTMAKISTFLHKEKTDCDGPVILKKRRFLSRPEPYCEECGYLMEDDPKSNTILTLYGVMLIIFGTMVMVIVPIYMYINGQSAFPGILVGGAMIVAGIIIMFIDAWIEVKRIERKGDLDVREG